MALEARTQREQQESLWIALLASAAHPFYERLNGLLESERFDGFAESACHQCYAEKMGRPSLTPGVYFRGLLTGLAKGSGIETPTREQLAKLDRKRKKRKSKQDWKNPQDPDAKITKMKDGSTHLAHNCMR